MTTGPLYPANPIDETVRNPIMVAQIDVTTDANGNASQASSMIDGEILKIAYSKGTVTTATTAVTKTTTALTGSVSEQIDSYDVNTASAIRYPRAIVTGASDGDNKWDRFAVRDTLTVTVASGQAAKTFTMYVYYR